MAEPNRRPKLVFFSLPLTDYEEEFCIILRSRLGLKVKYPAKSLEEVKENVHVLLEYFFSVINTGLSCRRLRDLNMEQEIVYLTAKLCYRHALKDSHLVGQVLQAVYCTEGHFFGIFHEAFGYPDSIRIPWKWPRLSSKLEDIWTLAYFVFHANNFRLLVNGKRFVDTGIVYPEDMPPIALATVFVKPDILMLLLQYGAQISLNESVQGTAWDISVLLKYLFRVVASCLQNNDGLNLTWQNELLKDAVYCIRLLLNVIPCIRKRSLEGIFQQNDFILDNVISPIRPNFYRLDIGGFAGLDSNLFLKDLDESGLVASLNNRYFHLPELKHLCRCVIRNTLCCAWQLPEGIKQLPLPITLKNYLDLLMD